MTTATATDVELKINAESSSLIEAIDPAIVVSTKSTTDDNYMQGLITLTVDDGSLYAKAYGGRLALNMEISDIHYPSVNLKTEKFGTATVGAKDLANALKSFPKNTDLDITSNGKELTLAMQDDSSQYQSVTLSVNEVMTPPMADTFIKEISLDRSLYLHGYDRIGFAVGDLEHKPTYLYWMLQYKDKFVRFAAGNGGRFAVINFEGDNCIKTSKNGCFYIPGDQSKTIADIIKKVDDDHVKIKQAERTNDQPDQIQFEMNAFTLMLVGFDTTIKWPNIDTIFDKPKEYRVATNVADWDSPTQGLKATWNEDVKKEHDSHESDIVPCLDEGYIYLTSQTGFRAKRKVPIVDVAQSGDIREGPTFYCNTKYIGEIFEKNDPKTKVELQYNYDPNATEPIFIIPPKANNGSLGVTEHFQMFFAQLKKG